MVDADARQSWVLAVDEQRRQLFPFESVDERCRGRHPDDENAVGAAADAAVGEDPGRIPEIDLTAPCHT
jgi:hypothetical protein